MSTPFDHPDNDPTAFSEHAEGYGYESDDRIIAAEIAHLADFLARPEVGLTIEGNRLAARIQFGN
ncbi:MAG: hypothetical protein GY906_35625 [bacterium]|nr:hypothetical protein [bacterium]